MGLIGIFTYFILVAWFQQYYTYHSLSKHSTNQQGYKMRSIYLKATKIPDGYFGETKVVHAVYDPQSNLILHVCSGGYSRSPLPSAIDKDEANWLIDNHSVSRNYYL